MTMKAKELRLKFQMGGYNSLSDAELKRFSAIEPQRFDDIVSEYSRRQAPPYRKVINSSRDAQQILLPLIDGNVERFGVLYVNRGNKVIGFREIGKGGISGCVADVRIIMKYGLELNATGIILAHNHPSGNARPSEQDRILTRSMVAAGKIMLIPILDHIIITSDYNTYYSFADEGIL